MKKLRTNRLLDAGILMLVIVAARVALAQDPMAVPSPRPAAPPRPAPVIRAAPSAPALTPTEEGRPVPASPMAPPTVRADGRIALQLKDGSRLVGKLVGFDNLKLKASFGEIDVPLDSILGLKLMEVSRPTETAPLTATILFKNGDVLTAEPLLGNLKLETTWGDTSVAGKYVESLVTTAEKVTWINDGKWRIVPEGAMGGYGPPVSRSAYTPYASPPPTYAPVAPRRADPFGEAPSLPAVPVAPPTFAPPMALPETSSPPYR